MSNTDQADALIAEREAKGIKTAMVIRVAYFSAGMVTTPFISPTRADALLTVAVCAVGSVIAGLALRALKRRTENPPGEVSNAGAVARYGLVGVIYEVAVLLTLPLSWYFAVGGYAQVPLSFFTKSDGVFIATALLAVNALSFRPLYPLILGVAATLQQIVFLGVATLDERTRWTSVVTEVHFEGGLHPWFILWRILTLALLTGIFTSLARVARRLVRRAVAAEIEQRATETAQAALVHETKMRALQRLVAGLVHELNTPLGVIIAGSSTAQSGATRIAELAPNAPNGGPGDLDRAARALIQSAAAQKEAGQRINHVLASLRRFARLEGAREEETNLASELTDVVQLAGESLRGGVRIESELDPMPRIRCRPREINQVFMTLVTNAFEAMKGEGVLKLRSGSGHGVAWVEIEDTGPGISEEKAEDLFELKLTEKGPRMGMGLGLPVSHRVIEQHGGTLNFRSTVGEGTCFRVQLPVLNPEPPSD